MSAVNKLKIAAAVAALAPLVLSTGCATGRVGYYHGVHYRHYYGSPWGGYRRPIIVAPPDVGREVDPDWGVEPPSGPEAMPLPSMPDMGMPGFGGDMGMGMDMGGLDW